MREKREVKFISNTYFCHKIYLNLYSVSEFRESPPPSLTIYIDELNLPHLSRQTRVEPGRIYCGCGEFYMRLFRARCNSRVRRVSMRGTGIRGLRGSRAARKESYQGLPFYLRF